LPGSWVLLITGPAHAVQGRAGEIVVMARSTRTGSVESE